MRYINLRFTYLLTYLTTDAAEFCCVASMRKMEQLFGLTFKEYFLNGANV